MDWASSLETTTIIWIAAVIGFVVLIVVIYRNWASTRRIINPRNIDQQLIKEELRDAKRSAVAGESKHMVIVGDLAIKQEKPKKIIGMNPYPKFVTIFYYENFWTWGLVDVYRPLAPNGFESKYIRIQGIGIKTIKGRGTVVPNSISGISWEEVVREVLEFRLQNHLAWGVAQSSSQLNTGMYEATQLKTDRGNGLLSGIDEYQFKELAKDGAEKFVGRR